MTAKQEKAPGKSKKKGMPWQIRVLVALMMVMAAVLVPTTIMLIIGMMPTLVILVLDKSAGRNRAVTVGAMNLAGCSPFIMELWMKGHTIDTALMYITEPRTIVVMYFAAAIGYMIEWSVVRIVAGIVTQKARARIITIEKEHTALEERWGREVSGRFPMDEWGFAVEDPAAAKADEGAEESVA